MFALIQRKMSKKRLRFCGNVRIDPVVKKVVEGGGLLIFQINMIILIFVKINTHNFILALSLKFPQSALIL